MIEARAFTAAEAAFVLREPIKVVKKALDDGPIEPKLISKSGGTVRAIVWADLLYLLAVRTLRAELTPKARAAFYHALKREPVDRTHEVRFGRLCVTIDDFKTEIEARATKLAALVDRIEFRSDGEAMLKGTDVEVHRIAALIGGGMTPDDICGDYPSLTPARLADAKAYADAYPKTGRPYPRTTLKRALKGAGLEALDEVLDGIS